MSLSRIISLLSIVLMVASTILFAVFYFGSVVEGTEGTPFEEPKITNFILTWTYILFGIAIVATLGFSIINTFSSAKNAKKSIMVIIVMAAVVVLSYITASSEVFQFQGLPQSDNLPSLFKYVGTGLNATYLLFGFSLVAIVVTEIVKIFR